MTGDLKRNRTPVTAWQAIPITTAPRQPAGSLPNSATDYFEKPVRLPDIETQRLLVEGE